jgi:hypothetical protein
MEKMKELYMKIAADPALQAKFAAIMKEAAEAGEATKEKLTTFAKEAGYDVSLEEAREYFKSLAAQATQKDGALSDAELDTVAGGKTETGTVVTAVTLGIGCFIMSFIGGFSSRIHCEDYMS